MCVREKRGWGGGGQSFDVLLRLILLKLTLFKEKERKSVPDCPSADTKSCFFV